MRKAALFVLSMFAVVGLTATAAGARANPHTIGQPNIDIDSSGDLTVQWKVAGLGSFTSDAFLTASRVEAVWGCDNPGVGGSGIHIPPGQPIVEEDVVGETTTIPPANGQVTFTVGLSAPDAPAPGDVCPGGNWSLVLVSVTYFDVELHIQQNGVDVLVEPLGDISETFFTL